MRFKEFLIDDVESARGKPRVRPVRNPKTGELEMPNPLAGTEQHRGKAKPHVSPQEQLKQQRGGLTSSPGATDSSKRAGGPPPTAPKTPEWTLAPKVSPEGEKVLRVAQKLAKTDAKKLTDLFTVLHREAARRGLLQQ